MYYCLSCRVIYDRMQAYCSADRPHGLCAGRIVLIAHEHDCHDCGAPFLSQRETIKPRPLCSDCIYSRYL